MKALHDPGLFSLEGWSPSKRRRSRETRHHRQATEYMIANTRLCEACGDCVEACPKNVLDLIKMPGHKHVRVRHPEECRGCGRCVSACPHGAIALRELSAETVG